MTTIKTNKNETGLRLCSLLCVVVALMLCVALPSGAQAQTSSSTSTPTSTTASSGNEDVDKCMEDMKKDMEKGLEKTTKVTNEQVDKGAPVDLGKTKGYCLDGMLSYFNAVNVATSLTNIVQGMANSILNQLSSGICNYVQAGVNNLLSGLCISMPNIPMPNLGIGAPTLEGCNSGVPLLTMSSGKSLPVPDMSGYFKDINKTVLDSLSKSKGIELYKTN